MVSIVLWSVQAKQLETNSNKYIFVQAQWVKKTMAYNAGLTLRKDYVYVMLYYVSVFVDLIVPYSTVGYYFSS